MLRSISKQSGESVISLLYGICYVLVVSHYAEIIDPFCHVCGACKVCEARAYVWLSVCLPVSLSVCLSVRSIIRPPHAAAAGLLLWARRPGDIDRLLHCRRSAANAGSVTLSADVASSTQTCYTGWAKKRGH